MNTIRFTSKNAFIEALEARRKFWRDYDQRQERRHKDAEKKWLTDARMKMREASKWSYADFKTKNGRYSASLHLGDLPQCPVLMEAKLNKVVAALQLTQGKSFSVDTSGVWAEAHNLLTWDPDARTAVC